MWDVYLLRKLGPDALSYAGFITNATLFIVVHSDQYSCKLNLLDGWMVLRWSLNDKITPFRLNLKLIKSFYPQ